MSYYLRELENALSKDDKNNECPICKRQTFFKEFSSSYDEPPEEKTKCKTCGFTEYYFYYDGFLTYMKRYYFHQQAKRYGTKYWLPEESQNDFISREDYLKLLLSELDNENLSIEDLIKEKTNAIEHNEKVEKERRTAKEKEKIRWEKNEYSKDEIEEINKTLNEQIEILKKYESAEIVENLKVSHSNTKNGLFISDISFQLNEEKLEEYISRKFKAQKEFAIRAKTPMFAMRSCFSCNGQVFGVHMSFLTLYGKTYNILIDNNSLEKCSSSLITGCPRCSRSFVD